MILNMQMTRNALAFALSASLVAGRGIDSSTGQRDLRGLDGACGSVGDCFLVNLETGDLSEVKDYSADSSAGYTIVCEANTSEGDVDKLTFLFNGEDHTERRAPYTMMGDRDGRYKKVRYLGTCGSKEVTVEAYKRNFLCDTKTLKFEACPSSFFDITLRLVGDAPNYAEEFDAAVAKWESVIQQSEDDGVISGLPPFDIGLGCGTLPETIDDVFICGTFLPIDGPGMIVGGAAPFGFYTDEKGYVKSFAGIMIFDSADVSTLGEDNGLLTVLEHEMAHVLGIGTLWAINGLTDESNYFNFLGCPYGSDTNASREWGRISGCQGQSVFVEDCKSPCRHSCS